MERRVYLATVSSLATVGFAGCSSSTESEGPSSTESEGPSSTESEGPSSTESEGVEEEENEPEGFDLSYNLNPGAGVGQSGIVEFEITNNTSEKFELVPLFFSFNVPDGGAAFSSFGFHNFEPGENRTCRFQAPETSDPDNLEVQIELYKHQPNNPRSEPWTFGDDVPEENMNIPVSQDDLRVGEGDLIPEFIDFDGILESIIFRIPAEEHRLDGVVEVQDGRGASISNHYGFGQPTIRDNNDIELGIGRPYWFQEYPTNIISTSEEREFTLSSPVPEHSMEVVGLETENQTISDISLEITAENSYPLIDARIDGVIDSNMAALGDQRLGNEMEVIPDSSDDLQFVFRDYIGVDDGEPIINTVSERVGTSQTYTIEPNFEPDFPIDGNETLGLRLISGKTIITEAELELSEVY